MFCLVLFYSCVFSIAITSLGEERANLSAFRTFVRFLLGLVLLVSSSSWCLGRVAVCNCGISLDFSLTLFLSGSFKTVHLIRTTCSDLLIRKKQQLRHVSRHFLMATGIRDTFENNRTCY